MLNIILNGCFGRMGQELQNEIKVREDLIVVAGVDRNQQEADFPIYQTLADVKETADFVIDFSHESSVPELIEQCIQKKLPVVIATTGLSENTKQKMEEASHTIPIFYSANMSLGINVLIEALQKITPALEDDFNIEIVEKHHNQKKDAPSGTALLLADSINDVSQTKKDYIFGRNGKENSNPIDEMGIHAVRGGTIPGEHTVIYAGNDEVIEFKHTALSRRIFANGALKAGLFLKDQSPGMYSMSDLLK
ncbi:4-hydroxy-tetrahydrodipicolinate reductase [Tetragenococcus halophilus]|uniref:4-hydroxy-tetrahydrodipicolinate reductase n=2 Tax=Tetragenococcus halophilus TaxID=51669 RepID=A0A2H6DLD4_TETHA|nr:4-hydroxy-tetrahydrodipicolinate reductase [Tetragenococcus halophilus]AYW51237.1 4-hydroxy-tetrahydrodipicolinate reductase [Tetragenococcus halophilus]MCF1600968.1 4-hydroxy-tetrahydrodipicolinate reductase [Tetragenococcus halophilus]MCF1674818.1 4-hydroxy-tetrahydrodipicolinate reductase [Tetragenococcus halophilus]MCO8284306.1 4-hydroxy-tetrahydrodipicolinate reductase [Tetragenococcus halophilus]MCO8285931.1 4-hydroxy-tetrahydrodipicolinate reductase [Tetragenococcus halophilus]